MWLFEARLLWLKFFGKHSASKFLRSLWQTQFCRNLRIFRPELRVPMARCPRPCRSCSSRTRRGCTPAWRAPENPNAQAHCTGHQVDVVLDSHTHRQGSLIPPKSSKMVTNNLTAAALREQMRLQAPEREYARCRFGGGRLDDFATLAVGV